MVNTNYCYIADNDFLLPVLDPPALLAPELQPLQRLLRHDGRPVWTCESIVIVIYGHSIKSVGNIRDGDGDGDGDGAGGGVFEEEKVTG